VVIPVERLLVRLRQVPSRADELIALRQRVRGECLTHPGDEERTVARELRALKMRISMATAAVSSCTTCATGRRPPRGTFAGGDCCSGVTADLFSDDEVAALVFAGTRPRHLRPPRTEHAGCAFRGEVGCTLAVQDRPQRCVHYTCHILRRELSATGELVALDVLLDQLQILMARFVALRAEREEAELFAPFEQACLDVSGSEQPSVHDPRPARP
jgi:hypothetical protein